MLIIILPFVTDTAALFAVEWHLGQLRRMQVFPQPWVLVSQSGRRGAFLWAISG